MLSENLKQQLVQYLAMMEGDVVIQKSVGSDNISEEMDGLLNELQSISSRIKVEAAELDRTPSFTLAKPGEKARITFAGVPLGHEFTSLILALLQVSGRAPKIEDDLIEQIKALDGSYNFETFISLTCQKCPDVIQALNMMAVINPNITSTMIDGVAFKEEAKDVMAVPSVFLNKEMFGNGRMVVEDILAKLGAGVDPSELDNKEPFEVLVIGGGPASASAAIYSARKGIRTGIVADRIGGQVNDSADIENFIGIKKTNGPVLSTQIAEHIKDYNIDVMIGNLVKKLDKKDGMFIVELENGAALKSKAVIIATGARYRKLNIPGELELANKGVAYCPHCDGPLFQGQRVAVVGGGNSGVEAAIDLSGIASHVTLLERGEQMKADIVLQDRLRTLNNVEVITNATSKTINGEERVGGIVYRHTKTNEEAEIELDGVFVQIGLIPNTEFLGDFVKRNDYGEIVVDRNGATSVEGLYAAGDCTDETFKQIIISMGAGATAALSTFDYLIRH